MSQLTPPATDVADPPPPKVYRVMRRELETGLPVIGTESSSELGVRAGIDVTVNAAGFVNLDGGGMSVVPGRRDLHFTRVPRHLRDIFPGAAGSNTRSCFVLNSGPFEGREVASGLILIPDPGPDRVKHGVIAPILTVSLAEYQADLANTTANWKIDET